MKNSEEVKLVGKKHDENQVIKLLIRKRIRVNGKTITITDASDHIGIKTLGKLDFLRKMGYAVINEKKNYRPLTNSKEQGKENLKKIISKPKVKSIVTYKEKSQLQD